MNGMKTIAIRMAKATSEDLDAAFELADILTAIERGFYPAREGEKDPPTYFDIDDREHLQYLHARLVQLATRGSLFRVAAGLETLLHPSNAIVDPDDDCIALHPRFKPMTVAAPDGREVTALAMASAPRDGTLVRLLVQFTEHATEDAPGPAWTIGANNFDHDGEDSWKVAGWCWSHDHFTQGVGTPVAWLPMLDQPAAGEGGA